MSLKYQNINRDKKKHHFKSIVHLLVLCDALNICLLYIKTNNSGSHTEQANGKVLIFGK